MRYVVSDIHGNYSLLVKLLKEINFSKNDKLFVLGDTIDKAVDVGRLLKLLFLELENNVFMIAGNHEYEFSKYMSRLIDKDFSDENLIRKAKEFLGIEKISIEQIDMIMNMPYYYEEKDFILVHAGIPFDMAGKPITIDQADIKDLVYDRKFKNENFLPLNMKCVIFGHTPTLYIGGEKGRVIKYQRRNTKGNKPADFYKIHIDTGNYLTGILGCLRLDDMQEFYVNEFEEFVKKNSLKI